MDPICNAAEPNDIDGKALTSLVCTTSGRKGSRLSGNIRWIEDTAAALPPVALDEVPMNPDVVIPDAFAKIPSGLIEDSPYQVRQIDEGSDSFKELVESVRANGLCNPLTVRKLNEDRYELIAGHRRRRACDLAGMMSIPCYIRSVDEEEAEALTCVENLNREDLLPIDEALTVKAMLDHGRSREEIAKITGKSVRWVYRREAAARLEAVWIEKAKKYSLSSKFLEFAAALDSTTRENILSKQFDGTLWEDGGNLGMLEKLSMVAHRKLVAAPWMGVCPEECNACKKRTDASELVAEDGEFFCLDAECWARHMAELADRTEAKCKAKGIPVKRVSEETLMEMDVEEARSEEYDTCVLSTTERGEVEIYWGRSLPKAEKLQKKAASAIKKPTEQNVFEMAYAGEVLRRVETLATSETDLHGFLACCLMVGLDTAAFRPEGTKGFICDERTKALNGWMNRMVMSGAGTEVRNTSIVSAFQDCVISYLRNGLEARNPLDTASHYLLASAVITAFGLDEEDVKAAAQATIKQAKKRK